MGTLAYKTRLDKLETGNRKLPTVSLQKIIFLLIPDVDTELQGRPFRLIL